MSRMGSLITGCLLISFAPSGFADEPEALKSLVEKAVKVAGVEKVQSIRAWTQTLKVTDRNEAIRSGTLRLSAQLQDRLRWDFESVVYTGDSPMRTIFVIDGRKGWRKYVNDTEELSPEAVVGEKARIRLRPGWSRDVALLRDRNYQVALGAETMIDGRGAVRVEVARQSEPPVRLSFDKETCRLMKTERRQDDGQQAVTTYKDYREVEGILVPHSWTFKTDGNVDNESDIEGVGKVRVKATVRPEDWVYELIELKFADELDAKLFEKP